MFARGNETRRPPQGRNPALLLIALLFALLVAPALELVVGGRILVYAGVTTVLIFGVFVNRARSPMFFPCLLLALLALSTTWSTLVVDYPLLFVASCVLEAAFYAIIAVSLLVGIFQKYLATVQSVFGAVCAYLLLGLSCAQLYWATERMDRESLSFPDRGAIQRDASGGERETIAPFSEAVYFSFVTMSTLGYGDIVPQSPLARTIAWMQSVLGQFYLAVLVAWLVGAIPRRAPPSTGSGGGSKSGEHGERHAS